MRQGLRRASSRRAIALACGCIALAALAAYRNSFSVPFLFDDSSMIADNPTIRHLSDIGAVLAPPNDGSGVTGRPVINLSLAINYAISGTRVWSYHALNLLIHILAGLTLFGIVRRTLERWECSRFREKSVSRAEGRILTNSATALHLALAIALIWTLHPLQTESVTCVAQRTELFAGLFYLLTLYCFVRGSEVERVGWYVLSVLCCLLGMASKEVMVSAPLMVFLYDRTFVAGTFREAWNRRRRFYLALAGTWLLLGYLVAGSGGSRGTSAGFGLGIAWWSYGLKQCEAVVHYLRLSIWPRPLIVDYGNSVITDPLQVWPQALLLAALAVATLVALWRRPVAGFLGTWFFVILAPSSSVVPLVTQTVAEHRMYLPLAAIAAAAVAGFYALGGARGVVACLALAVGLGALTARRNEDYRSELSIWTDNVAKYPANARAYVNLGDALRKAGRSQEAVAQYAKALRLKANQAETYSDLGAALLDLGRPSEAAVACETALTLRPDFAEAQCNLATALVLTGRTDQAIGHFEAALRIKPDFAEAHANLAGALIQSGRYSEAIEHCEAALRLDPDSAKTHCNLGIASLRLGRIDEATRQFEIALRLDPAFANAHYNLAIVLAGEGRREEAIAQCEEALRLDPNFAAAREGLEKLQSH